MTRMVWFVRGSAIVGTLCLFLALLLNKRQAHAMEFQEVKPYVFAELPHGRIYKTVHEGCELYIVETDFYSTTQSWGQHQYAIATGKGCK